MATIRKTLHRFSRPRLSIALVLTMVSIFSPWFNSPKASACGAFVARTAKHSPALELEQVLIIHDPTTEKEHFIRQINFRQATEPFGFVVPTPTMAEVAKVETAPFDALAATFPPEPLVANTKGRSVEGSGGGPPGGGSRGVTVLSIKKVGSFTAFVLAADDSKAFKTWLINHKFVSSPETDAWLSHYVALGFYYVAFRYDPPKLDPSQQGPGLGSLGVVSGESTTATQSETVRLTFSTPIAFYPYLEPSRTQQSPPLKPRTLAVWFAGPSRVIPVAAHTKDNTSTWQQPWTESFVFTRPSREKVSTVVGKELSLLLPQGLDESEEEKSHPIAPPFSSPTTYNALGTGPRIVVQAFEDQKKHREGWGDVLLLPEKPTPLDANAIAKRKKLFALLDQSLVGAK